MAITIRVPDNALDSAARTLFEALDTFTNPDERQRSAMAAHRLDGAMRALYRVWHYATHSALEMDLLNLWAEHAANRPTGNGGYEEWRYSVVAAIVALRVEA